VLLANLQQLVYWCTGCAGIGWFLSIALLISDSLGAGSLTTDCKPLSTLLLHDVWYVRTTVDRYCEDMRKRC